MNKLKKCYVCWKKLGFAKVVLNPKTKLERSICLNTTTNPSECYAILRQFATWGKCSSRCCGVGHMSDFDFEKHIAAIKGGKYISKYTVWATNLLQKVGRI